jgi:C4-dicarboxylate transporter, DctM subunit
MSSIEVGITLFAAMIGLMALRVPISIAMFVPGAIAFWLMAGGDALLSHLKGHAFARFSAYDLSVIPLFILMGQFATQGGLSRALFRAANSLVGHLRGGMAMASVIACAVFGAICGSSVATTATMAQVAMPEMRRFGYSGRFTTGTLAAGGTLGILIPPSVPLVVYAILAEQNIAKLFLAALVPGLIAAAGYVIAVAIYAQLHPQEGPAHDKPAGGERLRAALDIWPIVGIFVLVLGGIYAGLFTPTEGAAVGAAATFVAALARRELGLRGIGRSLLGTATTTGMIFFIFLGADMLNSALALSQMPAELAQSVAQSGWSPLLILACVLLFYVVMGCFMDELSLIILTIPVVFPTVMGLDLWGLEATEKAIWFGILMLTVVEIGLISPPVGLNVYVINSLARDVPLTETWRGIVPFLLSDAVRIALLFLLPVLSLYLVRLSS